MGEGNSSNDFLLVGFFLMYLVVHRGKILLRIYTRYPSFCKLVPVVLVYLVVYCEKILLRISLILRIAL